MVSIDYLEKVILPLIKKDCSENFVNDFACALGYYKSHNYEAFSYEHPEYDGRPDAFLEDSFNDIISSTTIVVEKETVLDVGDYLYEGATLNDVKGDKLYYGLLGLYEDAYDDGFLTVDEKGNFGIAPELDNGELADAISDDTGYCVDSIVYSIMVEGM